MKKVCKSLLLVFFAACLITSIGCKKDSDSSTVSLPTVATAAVSMISVTTAASGGTITSSDVEVTARGVCWSTENDPTIASSKTNDGTGSGVFSSNLTGLTANTTYFVRAYATNSAGTKYGDPLSFTTEREIATITLNNDLTYGTVSDIDGNIYKTVQIGSQTWMAENLRTTKLNEYQSILLVTDNAVWNSTTSPGYCWYNNDPSFKETYGALYNWFAVNTGSLCPEGWHVPNSGEFIILNENFGYGSTSGNQLKESGTNHWASPNEGATNGSGWTALPGGIRSVDGHFEGLNLTGSWWFILETLPASSGEYSVISFDKPAMSMTSGYEAVSNGVSVRCIQNN